MNKPELTAKFNTTQKQNGNNEALYTIIDKGWGYSVGHMTVNLDNGSTRLWNCYRRDIRFNLDVGKPDTPTFSNHLKALAHFRSEYERSLVAAAAYGEELLDAVRPNLPELLTSRDANGEKVTCIMKAAWNAEYIDKSVEFECTPQEALALLNDERINAACAGSRYGKTKGFLNWFSQFGTLYIGVGAYARDNVIASCKLAAWRNH